MHVLVVDDNPVTAVSLTELLVRHGYTARFEGDGLAALTYLDAPGVLRAGAIVLDLRMPGMDGAEFLERVAAREEWRNIPVVVATAASLDEQAHLQQRWPQVRLLAKPFTFPELLAVLAEISAARNCP